MQGSQINSSRLKQVIILPCSHELDYNDKGCDGHQGLTAQENTMICKGVSSCPTSKQLESDYCSYLPPITRDEQTNLCLDWSHYNTFYGKENGGSRKIKGSSALKCRDTNMIQQAIDIILRK